MTRGDLVEATAAPAGFGDLLRQHRLAAGLTQASLAERAGLSVHGIQKLERGATHPYRDTTARLSEALRLHDGDEAQFALAARPPARRQALHGLAQTSRRSAPEHNLPIQRTTYVAREGEISRVTRRLREARLLTITGSGGCGKTRLALEVARELVAEFTDGVWFVDLAPLADASLVAQTIGAATGAIEALGREPLDALTKHLRGRHALVVLDNCEHVVDTAARVVDALLQTCANLQVLTTSRELLGVDGEATWRVTSLSVVEHEEVAGAGVDATGVLATEAGRLFVDRAQLVVPSFALTDRNAPGLAQICRRLDGIALAIELAAARLTTLSVDDIAARLDQRFRLLTGGHRTAVRRQQTLEATIDWSYQLLSEAERSLVRRLSVFAGGWSLEAAEAVGQDVDAAQGGEDVLEILGQLVAKSMVLADESAQNMPSSLRYRFLETIRQYAEHKLLDTGEADRVRTVHRDWYLSLAEQAVDGMEGSDQKQWWDRLEIEHDNLRAALAWSASDANSAPQLLRLAAILGRFWQFRGHVREGIKWLALALARNEDAQTGDRARALNWLGQLERANGNSAAGRRLLEESITLARALGDGRVLSMALRHLVMQVQVHGPAARARSAEEQAYVRALIDEALAVSRRVGRLREVAWNLGVLGEHLVIGGEYDAAEPLLVESIALARQSGDLTPVVRSILVLTTIYGMRSEFSRARRVLQEGLALGQELDLPFVTTGMRITWGDLAAAEGDWPAAERAYRETLEPAARGAPRAQLANVMRRYAAIRGRRGDHRVAVRLLSACASLGDAWYSLIVFEETPNDQEAIATARGALGEEEFAREWAAGQSLTLEQAVAEALSDDGADR